MQTAPGHDNTSPPASWPLYRALVGVGVACGLLIVSVYVLTLPVIARNEAEALQAAVFQVLPGAVASSSFLLEAETGVRPAEEGDDPRQMVHAGYAEDGRLIGVAIEAQGMGYQDVIRILYGYAPHSEVIVGMQVLASKETPGLGDKIEKDPAFRANFRALDVGLGPDGATLRQSIEAVKSGAKTLPSQIDGITGATISAKAVADILRHSSARWVPLVYRLRGELTARGGTDDGN